MKVSPLLRYLQRSAHVAKAAYRVLRGEAPDLDLSKKLRSERMNGLSHGLTRAAESVAIMLVESDEQTFTRDELRDLHSVLLHLREEQLHQHVPTFHYPEDFLYRQQGKSSVVR